MEEGPEIHEWVEKTAHQQHEHAAAPHAGSHVVPAITAAILAVLGAFGSLLSGHAANDAILKQSQASDQWNYYQSKSMKGHIYQVGREIMAALGPTRGTDNGKLTQSLATFEKQVKKYDHEKEEVQEKAKELEEDSKHELAKHHRYAQGIAAFQVGIVLSSISIMVQHRGLHPLSCLAGAVGIILLIIGLLT